MRIHAVLTCHNRKRNTLECLRNLFECELPHAASLSVTLVDDGSSDGTSEAVNAQFPDVTIARGDGTLFWNRGMYLAQEIAVRQNPDYIMWINDDTILSHNAILQLISTYTEKAPCCGPVVVVGSTNDPVSGKLNYGGFVSAGFVRRMNITRVWNDKSPTECEMFNGNCVLIPTEVVRAVGNLDPVFEHGLGDLDYGLRIRRAGYRIFVAPGIVGYCLSNGLAPHQDPTETYSTRWRHMLSRKGLPVRSWLHYTRKHAGLLWPMYFLWPYLRLLFSTTYHTISPAAKMGKVAGNK